MRAVVLKPERFDERFEISRADVGRGKANVVLDAAPWEQPGLLKDHAERSGRPLDRALEEVVEPGDNSQTRRLAAAGRPEQRADLAGFEPEREAGDISTSFPAAFTTRFRAMRTSSGPRPPAGDMAFKRLNHEGFDDQHHRGERQGVGEQQGDVEQLEGLVDLEADAVRPADQLDDQHDLPHQRQAGAGRGGDVGRELRQDDVA